MSAGSRHDTGRSERIGVGGLVARALVFTALWAILSAGQGWLVGVPAILIATATTYLGAPASRWSLTGMVRFIPYFLWNSLRGGIDVAARALHPALPIDPAVLRYEMQLDSTLSRVLMANTVTLLPGTLSAELEGNVLSVHVLNASGTVTDMLTTLERRIADLTLPDDEARST